MFAVAVGAALVLMQAPLQAKAKGNTSTDSVCTTINSTIDFIASTYDEPFESLLLAPWLAAADLYNCE